MVSSWTFICFPDVLRKTKGICKLKGLSPTKGQALVSAKCWKCKIPRFSDLEKEQLLPLKTAVPITEEQTSINLHLPENMQPQADGVAF